jgi:alginate O-acetyltransferase complex protein AlgI
MNITSIVFFVFCTSTILVYWRLPFRFRSWWLLGVSTLFVVSWSWELACILLVVASTNHTLGKWLQAEKYRRNVLLWTGILFNILVLLALKYSDFYYQPLVRLFTRIGVDVSAGGLQLLVPFGLSFITLQMVSYLVDISRSQLAAEKKWLKFSIYVLYFPKFLSGPIERAKTFIPKLESHPPLTSDQIVRGLGLIFIGCIRKRVFADALNAMIPADAFVHPLDYSAAILLSWLVAYAFAIYNDFAGYSSIVRGVSSLFGIELTNNFNVPYLSRSFTEFWNRWHISLSNWLRDYIFFPTTRALLKKIPAHDHIINIIIPPFVTMLVSGLWHGISWNLLLWGGLQGGFLVLERISRLWGPNIPPDEQPKYRQILGTIIVFILVTFAWLPFRTDFVTAKRFFAGIILPSHWVAPNWPWFQEILSGYDLLPNVYIYNIPDPRILIVLIPAILLDWAHHHAKDELMFLKWPVWLQILFYTLVILVFFLMAFSDTRAPFVYQGF